MSKPDLASLQHFLATEFPQTPCLIEAVTEGVVRVRHPVGPESLRPGGTVSGPVLMAAADVALYVAILAEIGLEPLAVTTQLSINFLRKPAAGKDILAECHLLKTGRTLVVGEVSLFSAGDAAPVAHVVGTYAVPIKT
ncbi:PaaI family thioesterase [Pontibacter sp. JAM-7]|uniref:PaaI family thioesterase n=1 Tax=Pontibacter sp. JAM-7 TaxID=3366581 RepID=UPI003AF4150F